MNYKKSLMLSLSIFTAEIPFYLLLKQTHLILSKLIGL